MVVIDTEPIDAVTAYGSTIRRKLSCNSIDNFYGMISIRANEIEDPADRKPVVLASVVDKSGSMNGTKIMALKQTLLYVVQALGPSDSFGIVEYDSNVNITFPLTKMTEEAKVKATNIVLKLQPGSATNLSSGLLEGIRMIPKETNETVISSVLLMTDGLANNGITTTSGILSMIDFEEKTTQYTINTFGYGADHDTDMLKSIADAGNGMYYFIENDSSVAANFADCLGGLFSMIGQGLEFTISAQGGHKITKIWSQHVNEIEPGCKYRVNLGDIQAGESRDIPIQFSLAESTPNSSEIIAEAAISYYNVVDEKMIGLNCTLTVSRFPQNEEIDDPVNIDIDKHRNRCLGGQALLDASQLAGSGKISEARNLLQKAINEIEASDSASDSFCATLLGEMRTALSGFVDRSTFRSRGQFTARGRGGSYVSQRSSPASSSGALFGTNARTAMLQQFNTPIPIPEAATSVPSNSRGQSRGRGSYPTRGRGRGTR